ncbi:MAG: group I intron-associated PD-(D/E)XK endonuclease [Akkermansiaceae bacterium]
MKIILILLGFYPVNLAGDTAEAFFIHQAMQEAGLEVFMPFGHRSKIDVVVRAENGPLIGVQIKKAVLQAKRQPHHANSWKFLIGSCKSKNHHNPEAGPRLKKYKSTDFDILAAVIQEKGIVALYELNELIGTSSKRWNESDESAPRNNWQIITKKNNYV